MITIDQNINWLKPQSELMPSKIAIVEGGKSTTYKELYDLTCKISRNLTDQGIQQQSIVPIIGNHNIDFITHLVALWNVGAIPLPINSKFTQNELIKIFGEIDFNICLIDHSLKSSYNELNFLSIIHYPVKMLNNADSYEIYELFDLDDNFLFMLTSGSTSGPKIVKLSYKNLFTSAASIDKEFNFSEYDKWLCSLPLFHIGGLSIIIRALLSGSTLLIPRSISAEDLLNQLNKDNPTYISLVPKMLRRLFEKGYTPDESTKSIFLGGAPIQQEFTLELLNNGWPINIVYGSTETSSMVTLLKPEDAMTKINSAGKSLISNIEIINECDEHVETNEVGEIVLSGDNISQGYLNQPDCAKKFLNEKYYSNDLGFIDDNGYLFVIGRKDNVIISGGENINLTEVRNEILDLGFVEDVEVIGIENEEWGHISAAFIQTEPKSIMNVDDIKNTLKINLAAYKIPKIMVLVEKIDRDELGKVNYGQLNKLLN